MSLKAWKERIMKGAQGVINYLKPHWQKAVASLIIIGLLSGGALYANQLYQSQLVDLYYVYLHGKEIGVVNSPELVDNWFAVREREEANRYKGINLEFDKDVYYLHKREYKGTYDNAATLNVLAQTIEVKAKAFELVIDGEFIGYVRDQQTGEAILDSIKDQYSNGLATANKRSSMSIASIAYDYDSFSTNPNEQIKEINILEDVKLQPTMIDPEEMSDEIEMLHYLKKGTLEEQTYKVQPGDCLGCIAQKFSLQTAQLKQINPGIDENTVLQIGQELNVTAYKPKVTVQTVIETKEIESIPFETIYEDDNSLYKGQTKVSKKGILGEKEVTYQISKENGIEVQREALSEVILSEPVTSIVKRGTKAPPTVGSGIFAWPTVGGKITSSYGMRWGRMHNGIDISGVKDKTIKAADAGEVIHVGTKGNYGKTIIIDHKNGYETLYAHLSSYDVKKGQKVDKGQKIGVMGSTGRSTGTHLHFEITKDGKRVNPADAFK